MLLEVIIFLTHADVVDEFCLGGDVLADGAGVGDFVVHAAADGAGLVEEEVEGGLDEGDVVAALLVV